MLFIARVCISKLEFKLIHHYFFNFHRTPKHTKHTDHRKQVRIDEQTIREETPW